MKTNETEQTKELVIKMLGEMENDKIIKRIFNYVMHYYVKYK